MALSRSQEDATNEGKLMPTAPKPEHEIHDPVLARQRLGLWLQMLRSVRHMENELRERLRVNFDTTLPRFDVLALLLRKSINNLIPWSSIGVNGAKCMARFS